MSVSESRKQFDIYNDPNVSEAVLCRPVLSELVQKVSQLLLTFPNHPTLMQVCIIIINYNNNSSDSNHNRNHNNIMP